MKKVTTLACLMLASLGAHAHSVWIYGENDAKQFQADINYGHHFGEPETIAEKRVSLFETPVLTSESGTQALTQQGENYHFVSDKALAKGTYILSVDYKPTFWTKKADGKWEMNKTRHDFPDAQLCERAAMRGKSIVRIDDDGKFATHALGKGVEITPITLPSRINKDVVSQFKLTKDGQPLADVVILGAYQGFHKNSDDMHAFYAKTNQDGEFLFKPTVAGRWYLSAEVEEKFKDEKHCDIDMVETTLTFDVK
ncbi:DUF4198 domain-containing protein [Pasteurellaceae bacterium TAE3-ERU1]|nr:DUF4198 domain-containing protein [Pasteurellaceae bacterium TAE3-ERU1]